MTGRPHSGPSSSLSRRRPNSMSTGKKLFLAAPDQQPVNLYRVITKLGLELILLPGRPVIPSAPFSQEATGCLDCQRFEHGPPGVLGGVDRDRRPPCLRFAQIVFCSWRTILPFESFF